MILASSRQDFGVRAPGSSCAIAPHRGDVTTVMAAAAVRLRAERRAEEPRSRHRPHVESDMPRADATGR